ncbi:TetR/AcrR family transcriptional regulator [Oxalobacteraceae bacterium OM1]|nr:TetR/AcrR family transcriptional regulator [Oxalobacteraceae bacterium OM1]
MTETNLKIDRKEASHERILHAAAEAIRRHGVAGVSVADVMKRAGLTHGGFYAHFTSRDDMVAAAIHYAGKQSAESLEYTVEKLQRKGASPLRALIEAYLSPGHMHAPETGCVVAALGSDMARQSEPMLDASRERVLGLMRRVEAALPAAVKRAEAAVITSTLVGTLQLARSLGGRQGLALLETSRSALLDRYDTAG